MTGRSLKASKIGIEQAKLALTDKAWTHDELAEKLQITRQPVSNFFAGKSVDRKIFVQICQKLDLDWKQITDQPISNLEPKSGDFPHTTSKNADFVGRREMVENVDLVQKVRSHPYRRDKIQEQCGRLRILDVEWLVGIDNIYIDVNVLEKLPRNRQLELSDFQCFYSDTDYFERLGLGNIIEAQVPGLEAVARSSKLMVLGKPGSGKSTFLKFLAIRCNQGELQPERIPIFLELKAFARNASKKNNFSLLNYISEELRICEISDRQMETLLYEGRFLILLDGLDEVKKEAFDTVLSEVSDFSTIYFRNQFVISCRTATYHSQFEHFINVEIADFNREQIENFAKKWFVAIARNSTKEGLIKATQFLEKLYLPENQQIRELAVTPILLNLICLVFQDKGDFPSKRSKLYEQGLDILLQRWDESRNIKRDEAYRHLSLEDKKELLSYVAFITFERGDYFFEEDQIQQRIADYLRILPDTQTESRILKRDSKAVLKSIEAQHGLLVERARGIYSFSHLTFQEYFTARQIFFHFDTQALKHLFINLTESRWQEVFLLLVEMTDNPDEILLLMKEKIDEILADDEELQRYLRWVSEKTNSVIYSFQLRRYKPAAIRAFYFSLHDSHACDDRPSIGYFEFAYELGLDNPNSYCLPIDDARALINSIEIDDALQELIAHPEWAFNSRLKDLLKRDLNSTDEFKFDPEIRQHLQDLQDQIPDVNIDKETKQKWWQANRQDWVNKLRDAILVYRDIGHDWQFSEEQAELLQQYYEANELLVYCLNSSCEVSDAVRSHIENTLLLPIAEIDRQR